MGSSRIIPIVERLVVAGIIKRDVSKSWADFLASQNFTPGVVSIAVTRAINSGERYIHLGQVTAICREEMKRLEVDRSIEKSHQGREGGERWKGVRFFQMIKEAMAHDESIDIYKALLKANHWGRDNSPIVMKDEWDRSDKSHLEAIDRLGGEE